MVQLIGGALRVLTETGVVLCRVIQGFRARKLGAHCFVIVLPALQSADKRWIRFGCEQKAAHGGKMVVLQLSCVTRIVQKVCQYPSCDVCQGGQIGALQVGARQICYRHERVFAASLGKQSENHLSIGAFESFERVSDKAENGGVSGTRFFARIDDARMTLAVHVELEKVVSTLPNVLVRELTVGAQRKFKVELEKGQRV